MTTTADLKDYLDAHGTDGDLPDADVRVEVYQHRSGDGLPWRVAARRFARARGEG
jgi:hypothetical protein